MSEVLDFLTQKGAARILVRLLDGDKFMTQLYKGVRYPEGIATQQAITSARTLLVQIGLVEQYNDDSTPRPRLYLRLTEKGRVVAEHLKEIETVLIDQA